MANTNCLEGVKCPKCKQEERFHIEGTTTFVVYDEGTDSHGDIHWDEDSCCRCGGCDFSGVLADFQGGNDEPEAE